MRSAAARQVVLALHGSNGGDISRRSLHDLLALHRGGLPLLRLEYLPHFGDAETARQDGGRSARVECRRVRLYYLNGPDGLRPRAAVRQAITV